MTPAGTGGGVRRCGEPTRLGPRWSDDVAGRGEDARSAGDPGPRVSGLEGGLFAHCANEFVDLSFDVGDVPAERLDPLLDRGDGRPGTARPEGSEAKGAGEMAVVRVVGLDRHRSVKEGEQSPQLAERLMPALTQPVRPGVPQQSGAGRGHDHGADKRDRDADPSVDVGQPAWVIHPAGDGQLRLLDRRAGSSTASRRRVDAAQPAARRSWGRTPASDHGAARPSRRPPPPVDGGDPPRYRRQRGCRRTSTARRSCDQCAPVRAARTDIAV